MNPPTVSVIIPAYNCAAFLPSALESVRCQTYRDYEVLVVDDGSTDGTMEAAQEVAAKWPALRVIRAEHGGLARARNRGLAEMNGQWVALLDGDDLWQPEKLRKCMDYLAARPHLSVVYHPMAPISLDGRPLHHSRLRRRQGWLTEALFHRIFIHDPSTVFHKRVIEACGPFDQSLPVCVGQEFWLRVSTKFQIGLIDEPLALRRRNDQSLTRGNRLRSSRVRTEMLERFYFEQGGRELVRPRSALRRMAKVRYTAGRLLLSQREYRDAASYLAKAIKLSPYYVKSYPYYIAARTLCAIRGK